MGNKRGLAKIKGRMIENKATRAQSIKLEHIGGCVA
jgi:hypothetical protein